jgi:hypothetical protein
LNVAPKTNYGYLNHLLAVGYKNTIGVTARPSLIHSGGKLNRTPKFMAISPDKNIPA